MPIQSPETARRSGNLVIQNAAEVVTCSGHRARCGTAMSDLQVIEDGAVIVEKGMILAVGRTADVLAGFDATGFDRLDARGKAVLPGFVDSHTHLVFGGYRADEFAWRLRGDSYMDILQRGGGILSTVNATRAAALKELVTTGRRRLDSMLSFGVTTVEGKSGYGLDRETEIRQLEAMKALNEQHPVDVVPTFLGAHAVPPEYRGRSDEFIEYVIEAVLPEVAQRGLAEFCDVFCERGVFTVSQSRRLLTAARRLGLKIKLHADEMTALGGAELAAELAAVSADHLLHTGEDGFEALAAAGVVATLLPATAFSLKEPYARARAMIDHDCAVALATDFNPGSCFTESIPLIVALATLYMEMQTEEAIMALTLNGAAAVDCAERIGSIDSGKQADLIVLEFPSYRFIPYHLGVSTVETVVKNGKIVYDKKGGMGVR